MINETLLKIAEFTKLPEGWHFGEGVKVSNETKSIAEKIFYKIFSQGITNTDAFPGVDGEIRVTGYFNEHYLEFTVEIDGSITYLYEINDIEKEYEEGLSFSDTLKAIKTLTNKLNPNKCLFDQSIKTIGINKKSDFKAWHSGHQVLMEESQPFVINVQSNKVNAYVPTQYATTPLSQILHQYSGNLMHPYSQSITKSTKPSVQVETLAIAI